MLQLFVSRLNEPLHALVDIFGLRMPTGRFRRVRFESSTTSVAANISSQPFDRNLQCSPTSWANLGETDRIRHRVFSSRGNRGMGIIAVKHTLSISKGILYA